MNRMIRGLLIAGLLIVVVVVLFTTVFPWVEANLVTDPTLGLLADRALLAA